MPPAMTAAQVARAIKRELQAALPRHTFAVRSFAATEDRKGSIFTFYWPDPEGMFRDRVQLIMEAHTKPHRGLRSAGAGYYDAKPQELGGTGVYEPSAKDERLCRESLERMYS